MEKIVEVHFPGIQRLLVGMQARLRPLRGLVFDASVFRLDFDDQIGNVSLPGGVTRDALSPGVRRTYASVA